MEEENVAMVNANLPAQEWHVYVEMIVLGHLNAAMVNAFQEFPHAENK